VKVWDLNRHSFHKQSCVNLHTTDCLLKVVLEETHALPPSHGKDIHKGRVHSIHYQAGVNHFMHFSLTPHSLRTYYNLPSVCLVGRLNPLDSDIVDEVLEMAYVGKL